LFDILLRKATYYQVDLTGTAEKVRLSGLPDSDWLAFWFVRGYFGSRAAL
jgi:hypothetical protein